MNWKLLAIRVLPFVTVGLALVAGYMLHGNQFGGVGWVWMQSG